MSSTWLDADPGVLAVVVAALLVGYYVVVEPWWGKSVFARLTARRPHDPSALIAFYRLTVGTQCVATVVVVLTVLFDPGVGAGSIGIGLPALGDVPPAVIGGGVGIVIVIVIAVVQTIRARRTGGRLPVAPTNLSPMIPVTAAERRWAATVAVGAGVSEELVFRGLLLAVAVGLGVAPVLAAVVLSVLFGVVHLYQGVRGVVTATLFGAVMATIALGTGSLLLPVLLHAAIDLRGLLLSRPAPAPERRD